ncbi:YtxH domain-containing protein [Parabacteroides sp. ZJ-118]|uniref:YtxH domain-containing protein n=1 Tax=Parabacteroides sp. ZJ-118 TaxID=2709398 RepID=UPI0013EDE964|nr:YtxH domain-containing protein [Parabacteroides sp. ZJ-118]
MKTNCSKFWLGLGLGSIIGVVAYRFSRSSKGMALKEKTNQVFHQIGDKAGDMIDSAKNKMANIGTKVADKVADEASNITEKADDIKNKVHNYAGNMKK